MPRKNILLTNLKTQIHFLQSLYISSIFNQNYLLSYHCLSFQSNVRTSTNARLMCEQTPTSHVYQSNATVIRSNDPDMLCREEFPILPGQDPERATHLQQMISVPNLAVQHNLISYSSALPQPCMLSNLRLFGSMEHMQS